MNKSMIAKLGVAGAAAVAVIASPVLAQRDPAYEAARQAGQIGEQPDGYLGVVGGAPASVVALVKDLNIKRKAAYTRKAQQTGSTVEQFAFTSGCNLIARTTPGEMYQTPSGQWAERGSGAPQRDSRCP